MKKPTRIISREKRVVKGQKHWCFLTDTGVFTANEMAATFEIPKKTFLSRCEFADCTADDFLTRKFRKGAKKGEGTRKGCKDVHHVSEGIKPSIWTLSPERLINQLRAIEGACPINTGASVKMTLRGLVDACNARQKDNPLLVALEEFGCRPCKKCETRKQILRGEGVGAIPPGITIAQLEDFV
jgi:hypothetical protein